MGGGEGGGLDTPEWAPNRLEVARLLIAHLRLDDSDDLWRALERAAEISARTLAVERVGIWFLAPEKRTLECVRLFQGEIVRERRLPEGVPLAAYPAYERAVESRRAVVAHDARTDPQTRELLAYLERYGVVAMLDAPVFLGGEVCGVVCHEHVGAPRHWAPGEVDFAVSVADMLSALVEQARRLTLEKDVRRRAEAAARHRKNEALVRMGAGIAHDFNTVLQGISVMAEQVGRETDEGARSESLRQIIEECQRGGRIVSQLLDVVRPRAVVDERLDLAVVVQAMDPVLRALLGRSRPLEIEVEPDSFVTTARTSVEQILLNLVTNARDATPDGGRVCVRVGEVDGHVRLEVADEGKGIEDTALEDIFDPFFTTKQHGSAGLGLWTVSTLAARSGARVEVTSAPARGSTFAVTWPSPAP
jgi:two-component system, cell cycle sensor histidine kinase and response regulator CckA